MVFYNDGVVYDSVGSIEIYVCSGNIIVGSSIYE